MILMFDYGGGTAKLSVSIGNLLKDVNSVRNATMLAMYNGNERDLAYFLRDIIGQVNQLNSLQVNDENRPVAKFLVADYKAERILCGISGPNSGNFYCVHCKTFKEANFSDA